jgi:KUP system potassium uptake protein
MGASFDWRHGDGRHAHPAHPCRQDAATRDPDQQLDRDAGEAPTLQGHGTAVFLTADPSSAPTALLHSLKHYKVLHEQNVVLTIITESTPRVAQANRITIEPLGKPFTRILIRFGFMETPNVPKALALARRRGLSFDIMSTSFFLSRRSVRPDVRSGMPVWQDRLFIVLSYAENADDASSYFQLPTDRVVEIGTQVTV